MQNLIECMFLTKENLKLKVVDINLRNDFVKNRIRKETGDSVSPSDIVLSWENLCFKFR